MTKAAINHQGPKVTIEEILVALQKAGEIPLELAKFYLTTNGGVPAKKKLTGPNREKLEIQAILSIAKKREEYEFCSNEMFDVITKNWGSPSSYFPIARDPGGNYFCLDRQSGRVMLVYNDDEEEISVSKSLEDFFKSLSIDI